MEAFPCRVIRCTLVLVAVEFSFLPVQDHLYTHGKSWSACSRDDHSSEEDLVLG